MIENCISQTLPVPSNVESSVDLVFRLLTAHAKQDYYAYERDQCWHIGLGCQSSLVVDSAGKSAKIWNGAQEHQTPVLSTLDQVARSFVAEHSRTGMKVFGHVGFNYAAHSRGLPYTPGTWPLLSLMVPAYQITVKSDVIILHGKQGQDFRHLFDSLKSSIATRPHEGIMCSKDISQGAAEYTGTVDMALSKIRDGLMTKVIVSRAITLPKEVDMLATLLKGRESNTPKRSFSFKSCGFESTGFSPELIMSLESGKVTTEPLAGTRAYHHDEAECKRLRDELENDPKEIIEHVISVKEAVKELREICSIDRVAVEDLMSVRKRGRVQHLGSRVAGTLAPGKDGWDALNVLFPSITASGIPKAAALEAIECLESYPRELYSGGVIMMDPSSDDFEATLVLRSVFQDRRRQWTQAGAGIISQSCPVREFTETCEKLATIAPFIMYKK